MPIDHIRYDILAQDALRGLVRQVLADAGKQGLPGEHHLFITFDTQHEGVRLSPRLREQYPEEMTIVLQHQFWDLKVTEEAFEVGLSFGGVTERLRVPFKAITEFRDPSVQFALQFQTIAEADDDAAPAPLKTVDSKKPDGAKGKPRLAARHEPRSGVPAPAPAAPLAAAETPGPEIPSPEIPGPGEKSGGAEVVRLDRFRKK